MAKIFQITENLENLGALKSGGQGSVYKARRNSNVITAVKILPTPIYNESASDKNFTVFENEVLKLKRVNEKPNPYLVKILNHGLTTTGSLPFIEMEYIDGPDLQDMLQLPTGKVFTIREVYKVAEQLASALSHCHNLGVKHGDIKSNNVKFDNATGNYKLIDFGLALLSEERRRSSMRFAGAIEFMAPEQSEGQMLFESDIYSYGILLYELLTGMVPFPLQDNSSNARIKVMLSHKEAPLPDMLVLRRQNLPKHRDDSTTQMEMVVPGFLIHLITKCLEKDPAKRFHSGNDLWQHILTFPLYQESQQKVDPSNLLLSKLKKLETEILKLQSDKRELQTLLNNKKVLVSIPAIPSGQPLKKKKTYVGLKVALLLIFILSLVHLWNLEANETFTTKMENKPQIIPVKPSGIRQTIKDQLTDAKKLLEDDKLDEALLIYKKLLEKQVPEAMYQYGHLALKGLNKNAECNYAYELIRKASEKKFTPAMSTLGFLYVYGQDRNILSDNGFAICDYETSMEKGVALLTQASLRGDKEAKADLKLLREEQHALADND